MQGKKVLMIVGDYVEDMEAFFPFQALPMVGVHVDAGCPGKKAGEKVKTAVHDFRDGDQTYCESRGHDFSVNVDLDTVDASHYAGLVIPGGRAPEYLRLNDHVLKLVAYFVMNELPIVAVCHGIQLLLAAGGIVGKTLTCYPACQYEVKATGNTFKQVGYDDVVVDKNLVTSPAWPGHTKAFAEYIKLLGVKVTQE